MQITIEYLLLQIKKAWEQGAHGVLFDLDLTTNEVKWALCQKNELTFKVYKGSDSERYHVDVFGKTKGVGLIAAMVLNRQHEDYYANFTGNIEDVIQWESAHQHRKEEIEQTIHSICDSNPSMDHLHPFTLHQLQSLEQPNMKLKRCKSKIDLQYSVAATTFAFEHDGTILSLDYLLSIQNYENKVTISLLPSRISESERYRASAFAKTLKERFSFVYKGYDVVFEGFLIENLKTYEKRKSSEWLGSIDRVWARILNQAKREPFDSYAYLIPTSSEPGYIDHFSEDFRLFCNVSGEDGKALCDYLLQKGHVTYSERTNGTFDFFITSIETKKENVAIYSFVASELKKLGYEIYNRCSHNKDYHTNHSFFDLV